jgi:hypothetical protein
MTFGRASLDEWNFQTPGLVLLSNTDGLVVPTVIRFAVFMQ